MLVELQRPDNRLYSIRCYRTIFLKEQRHEDITFPINFPQAVNYREKTNNLKEKTNEIPCTFEVDEEFLNLIEQTDEFILVENQIECINSDCDMKFRVQTLHQSV